jgi:endonuclease/exonuclease/phosphatase family metal-dependent hydrolase
MRNFILGLSIVLGVTATLSAQTTDTLRVMQYNLLQYPSSSTATIKHSYLSIILGYVKPDIIGVNELNPPVGNADNLLNSAIRPVLGNSWKRAAFTNSTNSPVANMLFYDSSKVELRGQEIVSSVVRDINAYHLYYNGPGLAQAPDTTRFTVIVCHLKAGSASQDSIDRAGMTQSVATWLSQQPIPGNYMMMGDFNIYSSQEGCYQNLLNATPAGITLYDPISSPGNWASNSNFAALHTQSTRVNTEPDGGSGGGMDDRLDHILINASLRDKTQSIGYKSGSFRAIGQDGQRYNQTINQPTNTAVSAAVANALYGMSDHLPISLDLIIDSYPLSNSVNADQEKIGVSPNPVEGSLTLQIPQGKGEVQIMDLQGKVWMSSIVTSTKIYLELNSLPAGVYILKYSGESQTPQAIRLIKL